MGESSATLKLYKDAELTEEATGTIGGSVYVVLEVKLGKYQKLVSNNATLRIEENYEEHSETERRWDQTVSFDSGWQKKGVNDEWQTTTETPQTKNSNGDEKYFRKVWSWATYSQPLGHNEQHTVEIVKVDDGEDTELSFTPTNDGDDGKNGPEPVNADVANLVITDVSTNAGNPDYFLFDPNSQDQSLVNPSVTFTFKNDGDTTSSHNRYHWWLWVRATDETNFVTYEGYLDAPGEKTVSVDVNNLPGVGTYAIDIHVWDTKNDDFQGILSKHLELASRSFELVNNSSADLEAQISYQIASDRDAQELTVDLFNPSLDKLKSYDGGTQKNYLYDEIAMHTFTDDDQGGTYTAVFTAKDDFADSYRDHKSRDMLAVNWKQSVIPFNIWKDGTTWSWLKEYTIGWTSIKNYFKGIGLPVRMWAGRLGADEVTTAGTPTTHLDQGWNVSYSPLSQTQQQISGRTVIVVGFHSRAADGGLDGVQGLFQYFDDWDLPPDKPGLAIINPYGLEDFYGSSISNIQMQWLMTNVMLHELTHSVIGTHHCGHWTDGNSMPHCVISSPISGYFYHDLAGYNVVNYLGGSYPSPWHSLSEINQMRSQLSINPY